MCECFLLHQPDHSQSKAHRHTGCSGFQYQLDFDETTRTDDSVIEASFTVKYWKSRLHRAFAILVERWQIITPEGYMCLRCNASSAWATNIPCTREMYAIIGGKVIPKSTMNFLFKCSN